ncbi:MAG: RecQ family ATP-dependent DNA helicase [Gemmatimonadota bacterium]
MSSMLAERLQHARRLLLDNFGYRDFRPAQLRVVQSILGGHDTLGVLPTGGGKSICFQIPALVLGGLTIVVSPLISLMQDQVDALARRGISAAFLNSSLTRVQADQIMGRIAAGTLSLLYVSPERLASLAGELRHQGVRPSLLAIDEAHCIAEWGHDFRPDYRELAKSRYLLGNPSTIALTGSATPEVRDDIVQTLRLRNARTIIGSFDRPNLWFGVVRVKDEAARLAALMNTLGTADRMAIVYAPTRGQTEILARALRERGFRASPYHAGLAGPGRETTLRSFLQDELDIVVATSAFGMGIDKPTVRLVVHWNMPPTMESYYQEAGRAGRDGRPARCVLLHHPEDTALALRQLSTTFPSRRLLHRIWQDPHAVPGVSKSVLESAERLRRELKPLDGPVDWKSVARRECRARERLHVMQRYAGSRICRRQIMLEYFGERRGTCHGCDRCAGKASPGDSREARPLDSRRWGKPGGNSLATPDVAPEISQDQGLAGVLNGWREAVARERAIPGYAILSDNAIREIARTQPCDLRALSLIEGIGPRFIAKHGAEVLEKVEQGPPIRKES